MKKADLALLAEFDPGTRVEIIGANYHKCCIGHTATVAKVIKSRSLVTLILDTPAISEYGSVIREYSAWPENLRILEDEGIERSE